MADNTTLNVGSGGDVIATDDIAGVKYQIVKLAYGALDTATLVSTSNPIPLYQADVVGTGTITATDAVVAAPAGTGALVSGASTAGSYVSMLCLGGDSVWSVQVTGLTSGTLYFEESLDSTTGVDGSWINVNGRQTGIVNTALSGNATTNGVWRGNASGAKYFRIRSVGTLSGTPAIVIRASAGSGAVFLNASLPAGSNAIGTVALGAGSASVGTVILGAGSAAIGSLAAGTASIGTVVAPTLTKGTQPATGFATQDLKDSGRTIVNAATAIAGVTAVTTEALLALNISRDGAATASATTIAVTSGKRLRIVGVSCGIITTSAAVLSARISLRLNPSGAAATTSPILATVTLAAPSALAQTGANETLMFPEAIEISGTMQVGLSQVANAATGTVWASLIAYEY